MNILIILAAVLAALVIFGPLAFACVCRGSILGEPRDAFACNDAAGTHAAGITRLAENAIGDPHLLVTQGTDDREVDVNGASDRPLGAAADPVEAGENVGVHLLAGGGQTILMIASEAIDPGTEVFTAAGGKVSTLSETAGTYYKVGTAIGKATADGDEIEIMPCYPAEEVVT